MKFKPFAVLIILFAGTLKVRAQYKDLEGVVLGKVIAFSVGGSYISYKDKLLGTSSSITPLNYSMLLNNKVIVSMQLSIHKKLEAEYHGNDGNDDYTKTISGRFLSYLIGVKFAVTPEGLGRSTSVFVGAQGGASFGKRTIVDSRWGEDERGGGNLIGGNITLFQRLGSRFVVFAEPSYLFNIEPKAERLYLDDNGKKSVSFSYFNGQIGIMYLIGRSN